MSLYVQPGYDWMWDGNNPGGTAYTPQQVCFDNVQIVPVPEPAATGALAAGTLVAGGAASVFFRRRRAD